MAIQNIKCPTCGGQIQMDDNFEKGFCMYCGGAIHIKEEIAKIKVEHSGIVEVDDSKKLSNSITLADRAFSAGNYDECYNYCCSALECDINNAHIAFRKGLCAAHLSLSRVSELEQAVKTSSEMINKFSDDIDRDTFRVFSELLAFIQSKYELNCSRSKGFVYPNLAAVNNTFSIVATLSGLCVLCSDLITDEMMIAHPTFEAKKRICLEQGIELCELGVSSLKYNAGYRLVKKGKSYVEQEVHEAAKSPFIDMQKGYLNKFKNEFNNLPTTKKALMEYDNEIDSLQKDIDIFTQKLDDYFKANPEIGKEYKKSVLPFVIPVGAVFVLASVVAATLVDKVPDIAFVLIMAVFSLAFVALAVLSIIRFVTYSKNRKRILNELPSELACLRTVHDQSKIKLKSVKKTKAAFVKKNVKK